MMIDWNKPANPKLLKSRIVELTKPVQPIPTETEPQLNQLKNVKAVVFDVYGTMFISNSGEIDSRNQDDLIRCMAEAIHHIVPDTNLVKEVATDAVKMLHQAEDESLEHRVDQGITSPDNEVRAVWQRLLIRLNKKYDFHVALDESTIEQIIVEYQFRTNPVYMMPGLIETLETLKTAGYILGIVCNAQFYTPLMIEALTGRSLEQLGFREEHCIWSYWHREAKPSTFLFDNLLTNFSLCHELENNQVVYVGNDMRNDIAPAHELGCRAILFAGDKRSLRFRKDDPICKNMQPEAVVTKLSQIPTILSQAE